MTWREARPRTAGGGQRTGRRPHPHDAHNPSLPPPRLRVARRNSLAPAASAVIIEITQRVAHGARKVAAMLDGLHRVWRAAEVLAGSDAGLRDRLKAARAELAASLRRPEEWPAGPLHHARSILRLIREDGATDPLDQLDAALARQVAEDILSLAADVSAGR